MDYSLFALREKLWTEKIFMSSPIHFNVPISDVLSKCIYAKLFVSVKYFALLPQLAEVCTSEYMNEVPVFDYFRFPLQILNFLCLSSSEQSTLIFKITL